MSKIFEIHDLSPCIRQDIREVMAQIPPLEIDDLLVRSRELTEMSKKDLLALHENDSNVELVKTGQAFGEVPVAIFRPKERTAQANCLLWFHGGGLIAGHYLMDYHFSRELADTVGCTVISVEYRLAPENPFPAGVNDGYDVYKWITSAEKPLAFAPGKVAVGGLSGGGPFAVGTGLKINKQQSGDLCFQLLLTPMLDCRSTSESINFSRDMQSWSRDSNRMAWDWYLAGIKGQPVPGEASPMAEADFANFPPSYICVGDVDCFRDEGIEFVRELVRAGVPAELHVLPQCPHGGDFVVPEGNAFKVRMRKEYCRALAEGFGVE